MSMFRPLQPHTSHVMQDCELPGLRKCTFCGRTNLQDNVELPCGHSDREAEIGRLTARIAELEKALRDVAEAKMPGLARYIARTTLEASERGGGE